MIIKAISANTGLSRKYVTKLMRTASYRYKYFEIEKRTKGFRSIFQPSKEIKLLQRWVADNIFEHLPIHECVYSYKRSIGIQDLAKRHKKFNYLLKVDFKDFFPSIKSYDVICLLGNNKELIPIKLSKNDLVLISLIVCRHKRLTIGSPSSPIISNKILFSFDSFWHEKTEKNNIVYSRYADDLYFSTNKPWVLNEIYDELKKYIKNMKHPSFQINEDKTVFTSKKHKRLITGLILTSDNKVSIGRGKKRYIKSLIHRFRNERLDEKEISYLRGYLSYVNAVEPEFLKNLKMKYGKDTILAIIKSELVSKKGL